MPEENIEQGKNIKEIKEISGIKPTTKPPGRNLTGPIVLAVACAIVFGGLGYYFGKKSVTTTPVAAIQTVTAITSATKTATAKVSATADETANWKTYTNDTYGFSLTFNDKWKGYSINDYPVPQDSRGGAAVAMYQVLVPTTDASWTSPWSPFFLYVYTPSVWKDVANLEGPKPTLINQNDNYAIAYSTAQDSPPSTGVEIMQDIKNVISTFQFTK